MTTLEQLNQQFAIPDHVAFISRPGGFTTASIRNALASCDITLHGAHVLSFQPSGEMPLLWLSSKALFIPGKAIRGGVPICWPWFANHDSNPALPAHGFARTAEWQVTATSVMPGGGTQITFRLPHHDSQQAMWPYQWELEYRVTVAATLTMELVTRNTGSQAFTIGEALHTYFAVGDIGETAVTGLNGTIYQDKTDGFKRKTEAQRVLVISETDRVYLDTQADCVIDDTRSQRKIRVSKQGSAATVIWNPWAEKCAQITDMTADGYRGMLCVESANTADNAVTVAPGDTHTMCVRYSLER